MYSRRKWLFLIFVIWVNVGAAQQTPYKKGSIFLNWGWNRAAYTNSTLQIKGNDYDLTLYKLKAKDKPSKLSLNNYLKIDRITIPQTNLRVGYFVKNNLAIVGGVDHMKYVMTQNQVARVKGAISREGAFKKDYDNDETLTEDFLTFEHTDGLNYVNVGVEKYVDVLKREDSKVKLHWLYGGTAGVMVPRTNVKFLDYERTDRFHVSGFGLEGRTALQALFFKHMTLRLEGDAGYIDMPDIILHKTGIKGKGKQNFAFVQVNAEIGYHLSL
ncbi:MAG: hypothetical protein QM727_08545 [Niabella sp.]